VPTFCRKGWQLDVDQTIVLIGHSLGGLVIKSLVVKAHEAAGRWAANPLDASKNEMCFKFLANIKGIIFYGVPHTGSLIAEYVKNLNKVFPLQLAGVMKNLLPSQNDMEQLSVNFQNAIDPKRVTLYAFAERLTYNKVHSLPQRLAVCPINEMIFSTQVLLVYLLQVPMCCDSQVFWVGFVNAGLGRATGFSNSIDRSQ
jgi:triacylglycerol esterase/lipase EstA (alpha/beta hydrolase family)